MMSNLPTGTLTMLHTNIENSTGLLRPERIFQLIIPGMPGDFPPLQTLDARMGPRSGTGGVRVLTTVLFTDIAGSTPQVLALGDRRWRALLAQYKALVRVELARYGGHAVDMVG